MFKGLLIGVGVFAISLIGFLTFIGPPIDPALLKPSSFDYPKNAVEVAQCQQQTSHGKTSINELKTPLGATYNLRTPSNYSRNVAHPLLVVYAPAGTSAAKSERHVHITQQATERGFIVAFADNIRLSLEAMATLSSIPLHIQENWCIDPEQIYYTGHSDGGTISNALSILPEITNKPTAIAPSAAGMNSESLQQYSCPSPTPVMVFHNTGDTHFENYGEQTAQWWANCNQCDLETTAVDQDGCVSFKNCSSDAPVMFCEGPGSHSTWPNKNEVLLNFFQSLK